MPGGGDTDTGAMVQSHRTQSAQMSPAAEGQPCHHVTQRVMAVAAAVQQRPATHPTGTDTGETLCRSGGGTTKSVCHSFLGPLGQSTGNKVVYNHSKLPSLSSGSRSVR